MRLRVVERGVILILIKGMWFSTSAVAYASQHRASGRWFSTFFERGTRLSIPRSSFVGFYLCLPFGRFRCWVFSVLFPDSVRAKYGVWEIFYYEGILIVRILSELSSLATASWHIGGRLFPISA